MTTHADPAKLKLCVECRKYKARAEFGDSHIREDGKWDVCSRCFDKKFPMPGRRIERWKK